MPKTFDSKQQTYSVGTLQGTQFLVSEEKVEYKTNSPKYAKIHEGGINNLKSINKSSLITLLYMVSNINRDPNAIWGNLGKYFKDGYLCFAKHQYRMAQERQVTQETISRHLKELREAGFIRELAIEYMSKKGTVVPLSIYCLGEYDIHEGNKLEVHYYELNKEVLDKLVTKNKSLFYHNLKYQGVMHHVA